MKANTSASSGGRLVIRRALISVSDKQGIADLARRLHERGIELISTGGTSRTLQEAGVPVTPISDVTGFPEILDGRVKTLHPNIHAGLLAVSDNPSHVEQLERHKIRPIDLVIVNLYPFESTVAKPGAGVEEAVENIDIGGPAMVRASAKNYRHTAVVVNPDRYPSILQELEETGGLSEDTRFELAQEAFSHTARYDAAIARYLQSLQQGAGLPELLTVVERNELTLRYGENPHQEAAFYGNLGLRIEKLHGRELSYNNILDLHAAASLCSEFENPAVVIVKHNNPCGVAIAATLTEAFRTALATDPKSAFGGIVAVNRPLDTATSVAMNEIFFELIAAPSFEADALPLLQKKKERRLIRLKGMGEASGGPDVRSVLGGFLVQTPDVHRISPRDVKTVTQRKPTENELEALLFAWRVAKHVKSNAIVYARGDRTLGIGAGQMSRVDSSRIAALKAAESGLDLKGSAVASDAFFPFPDGLLEAVKVGASCVIQPGGSVRDQEVIDAADQNSIAMVFTGIRHFRH